MASTTFTIATYNCHGFSKEKAAFVEQLFSSCDLVCLQEHWLHKSHLGRLNLNVNLSVLATSGIRDDDVSVGRPYGGVAIMWKSSHDVCITRHQTDSRRFNAVSLQLDGCMILLINVYAPCDLRGQLPSADLLDLMDEIETFVLATPHDGLVFAGGWNCDLQRHTAHRDTVCNFWERFDMLPLSTLPESTVKTSYIGPMGTSLIDHIVASQNIVSAVCAYKTVGTEEDECNLSDHIPLCAEISCQSIVSSHVGKSRKCRVAFYKASAGNIDDFKIVLCQLLAQIQPIDGRPSAGELDEYYHSLVNACIVATQQCIPSTNAAHMRRRVAGWTGICSELGKTSRLWHRLWIANGRPHDGYVAQIMRKSRSSYHAEVRKVMREQEQVKMDNLAQSLLSHESRDPWREVKRLRGNNGKLPTIVQAAKTPQDIAALFRTQYASLYTSVQGSVTGLDEFCRSIDAQCSDDECAPFAVEDIKRAVLQLQLDKYDNDSILCSSALRYAPQSLLVHITCLVNAISLTGHVPSIMKESTIIPLLKKPMLNPASLDSYRAISLSSLFGKIVDHLILHRYESLLMTSDNQFAFKPSGSCNKCTLVVTEILKYYVSNGSKPIACFLDIHKAFDRVNIMALFKKLCVRGLPPHAVRLLLGLYTRQTARVLWDGTYSDNFEVMNGVKQGGVLSPVLFCIYIDELFDMLAKTGVGCHIGMRYFGMVAYADDIVLLCPSVAALQVLLETCQKFAAGHDVKFSPAKSVCIRFGHNNNINPVITLDGVQIPWASQTCHLGHIICSDLKNVEDVKHKTNAFYGQVNGFLSTFCNVRCDLCANLFNTYCSSFYGCELWNTDDGSSDGLAVAWRKAIRRLWQLPNTTHCNILPCLMDGLAAADVFYLRAFKFVIDNLRCKNTAVSYLSGWCANDVNTHTGTVLASMRRSWPGKNLACIRHCMSHKYDWQRALQVYELCLVRDGVLYIENFSANDLRDVLCDIACN